MTKCGSETITAGRSHAPGRRQVLRLGVAGLASALATPALARIAGSGDRRLAFYNLHTGEQVRTTYWANGEWNPDALQEIDMVLRDFRTGDVTTIDRSLLNLLYRLSHTMDTRQPFHVISGYRSPKTNAMLAAQSSGVAKHSLHTKGMAIDIRIPGIDLADLRKAALSLKAGGVGYYPKSDFVHVDTGRVRFW